MKEQDPTILNQKVSRRRFLGKLVQTATFAGWGIWAYDRTVLDPPNSPLRDQEKQLFTKEEALFDQLKAEGAVLEDPSLGPPVLDQTNPHTLDYYDVKNERKKVSDSIDGKENDYVGAFQYLGLLIAPPLTMLSALRLIDNDSNHDSSSKDVIDTALADETS